MIQTTMGKTFSMEELVGTLLERLGTGDADSIAALFAEDIDWYVGGNPTLPWTGKRSHRADVVRYFQTMWPHFVPGKSSSTLHKVLTSGDDAVVLATFTHTAAATGRSFTTPVAIRVTQAEGRFTSLRLYEDTWLVSEAFLGSGIRAPDLHATDMARIASTVTMDSRYAFAETLRLLSREITAAGGVVFATIDQQAAALTVGFRLRPTTLILFGNPKGGTPLMDERPLTGLELPLKLLVWEEHQVVWVAYALMQEVARRSSDLGNDPRFATMDRLLKRVVESVSVFPT